MPSGTAHATLPWSWYSDPQTLPREQERIFRHAWQYVGPVEQAALAGEYFSSRIGDVPVLVVRGRDRRLRAFLNVCRHGGPGVGLGLLDGGQLLPRSEQLLAHFQELVREALA